jgi:hypothetical protein
LMQASVQMAPHYQQGGSDLYSLMVCRSRGSRKHVGGRLTFFRASLCDSCHRAAGQGQTNLRMGKLNRYVRNKHINLCIYISLKDRIAG